MKRLVVFFWLLSFGISLTGQQHDFGNVNELTVKKDTITYTLTGSITTSYWLYFKLTEQKPYAGVSLLLDSIKTGTGTDLKIKIPVEFAPKQNLEYKGLLTVENQNSVLGVVSISGQGIFSNSYYASTRNKTAEVLKAALKSKTGQGYVSLGYKNARIEMFSKIDNWKINGRGSSVNKVECIYTGRSIINYPFNTSDLVKSPWNFNTEHTFPQSKFGSSNPMQSDLHHLFPSDANENGKRGSLPFGIGSGKYEPRNEQKGSTARAMSYFVLRYQDYGSFYSGQESVLRQWMKTYPPSQIDIKRNNDIYALQRNRNPFVDYPQFLDRISSISGTAVDEKITSLQMSRSLRHQSGDTAKEFGVYRWKHILYNSGNQSITVDAIFSAHDNMNWQASINGGGRTVIQPNEKHQFEVAYRTGYGAGYRELGDSIIIKTNAIGYQRMAFYLSAIVEGAGSVGEHNEKLELGVYPNPVLNELYLEFNGTMVPRIVQIIDLQGKTVLNQTKDFNQMDVSDLRSGEYMVRLTFQDNSTRISRFLKQ